MVAGGLPGAAEVLPLTGCDTPRVPSGGIDALPRHDVVTYLSRLRGLLVLSANDGGGFFLLEFCKHISKNPDYSIKRTRYVHKYPSQPYRSFEFFA